jgi:crotonobetainyl-CoA:carnitine CoA-transferase CaiB-like acyl-CoA transferase
MRAGPALEAGMSAAFMGQNANKRSVAVDLKAEAGLAIVHRLIETADVVIHNMRPGTPDRLGIGYDAAKALNPAIIYCAISGYGQSGPMSERTAFDHLIQGESGMFMSTGLVEQPLRVGFAVADASTAVIASSAINGALVRKQRTGEGAFLDVSMLESCMTVMGLNYYDFFVSGQERSRVGPNPLSPQGSAGTFETSDGRLLLVNGNSHRLFIRLAEAVGRGDLLTNPRFSSEDAARENRVELRQIFAGVFITNTAKHWDGILAQAGVPAGIAKTPDEVIENPQLAHRKSLTVLEGVAGTKDGRLTVLNAGFSVDESPTSADRAPQRLGESTVEVLAEMGFSEQEIESLVEDGVIG